MNKIKVVNNKIIPFVSDDVEINDNSINFNNNGNYFIDYIDCNNVSLCINVNNNKCIHLFEYSNNNDINFNIKYNLDMASSLIISKFYYNNKCNEVVNISLNKRGANIKYNFSSISNNDNFYKINVYHLDNNTSSDVFNRISGTTGIMGSSDTTFILEKKSRDDSVATLFVTGRDVEYQTFTLRFEECRWNLLERSFQKDIEMKNAPEIIYNVISFVNDKGEWQGTATELLTSLDEKDITPQYLTKLLNEYSKTILLDNKICFKTSRTSTSRLVNFKKDIDGNDDDDGKNIPQESSLKGSPEGTSGTQLL